MMKYSLKTLWVLPIFLASSMSAVAREKRPNIVWVVMEDTSPQFIGCYGNKAAHTPVIDQLAKAGVRFTNAFASATVCSPSRSAIITGAPTYETGTGNHRSNLPLPDLITGFPAYLRKAGYYTTNNSKTDYNTSSSRRIVKESWDESSDKAGWWNRQKGQPFFAVFNFNSSHQSRTMTNPYEVYRKQVLQTLPRQLQVAEDAFEVPPFYADNKLMRRQLARVYNSIALADYEIGKVLERLKADGLDDSTIIFFYADHGEGLPRIKTSGKEIGHRIPMVIHVPEAFQHLSPWKKKGMVTGDLISLLDLAPTLLNLGGVAIPGYMNGHALLNSKPVSRREHLYLTSDGAESVSDLCRTITDGRYSYTRTFINFMPELGFKKYFDFGEIMQLMRADYRAGKLNAVQRQPFEPRTADYLYDTEKDPWQIRNLAADPQYRTMIQKFQHQIRQHMISGRDVMLLPHYELASISTTQTPYEFRSNTAAFPVEDIVASAWLSGHSDEKVLAQQLKNLKHASPFVRYWAAIGLRSQGAKIKANTLILENALNDSYPPVQIIVASILNEYSNIKKSRDILDKALTGNNAELTKLALQVILYQRNGKDFVPTVNTLLSRNSGAKQLVETFLYVFDDQPLVYDSFW